MTEVRRTPLLYMLALGTLLFIAGSALAAPTPDAGGDRTVDEDASTSYSGTDASGEGVTFGWIFDGAIEDGSPQHPVDPLRGRRPFQPSKPEVHAPASHGRLSTIPGAPLGITPLPVRDVVDRRGQAGRQCR